MALYLAAGAVMCLISDDEVEPRRAYRLSFGDARRGLVGREYDPSSVNGVIGNGARDRTCAAPKHDAVAPGGVVASAAGGACNRISVDGER